jgi:glycosyltransferase involved in cell wall biosynthesis
MEKKIQLSVIIASYNSGNLINSCLESLENQNTDQPFEIIVVNSSSDGEVSLLEKRFTDVRLYQFPERKFCGDARNFGLSVAKGEIIAFIDADCRVSNNWVDQIIKAHRSPTLAIGGAIANGNPESPVGWASYFCEFSQWMPGFPSTNMTDIAGANMSYKRRAFEEYGLFIEGTYSSDTEFHWRLRREGHFLKFTPSILTFHHNLDRIGKFLRHEFQHGRSFAGVRIRSQNFSEWRRLFYGTFSFLIPGWLLLKIGLRNSKNRVYLSHFLKAWPLLMLGLIAWSLGECVGYLLGSGDQTFIRPRGSRPMLED